MSNIRKVNKMSDLEIEILNLRSVCKCIECAKVRGFQGL